MLFLAVDMETVIDRHALITDEHLLIGIVIVDRDELSHDIRASDQTRRGT